jgi:hypothetical protein
MSFSPFPAPQYDLDPADYRARFERPARDSDVPAPVDSSHAWVCVGLPHESNVEPTSVAFVGFQVKVDYVTDAGLAARIAALLEPLNLHATDLDALVEDGPGDWGGALLRDNGFARERSGLVITTVPCDSRGNNLDQAGM